MTCSAKAKPADLAPGDNASFTSDAVIFMMRFKHEASSSSSHLGDDYFHIILI